MSASGDGVAGMFRYAWRLLPLPGIALSAALLCLLPVVVSFRFLDFQQVAAIGESIAPMLGILLLTPLAFCEGSVGRQEALACRPVSYWRGFALRLGLTVLFTLFAVCGFITLASIGANGFDVWRMGVGLAATAFIYGSLGLTIGHFSRSQPASYLFPFAFFALEFYTHGQYTGRFYTLSLSTGTLWMEKVILLGAATLVLLCNIRFCKRQVLL